jgi:replicative DNA helicase
MENSVPARLKHVDAPCSPEIELRTLSALIHLGNPNELRVQQAMLKLNRDCFLSIENRIIFELIEKLFAKKESFDFVDFITLVPTEHYELVTSMVQEEYLSTNLLEHDVEKLLTYRAFRKQLRTFVNAANYSLEALTPEDSLEVISEHLQELSKSHSTTRKSYLRAYETIADEFLSEDYEDNTEIQVDIPGLPPVPNRSLITIAGRSGHGKTFFGLHLMDKLIDAIPNRQTIYFNLEMDERVMMERHATLLGIKGNSRKDRIANGIATLLPKNVSLVSEPMMTIEEIETESRLASLRQPIAVIVVDYLGLIRSKSRSERKDLEQGDIAKRLAALSLELNCIVIALIQVNREFKNRPIGQRCPVTSDASESMGSVHSSSWWIGIDQPQADSDDLEWRDQFLVACRKNRGDAGLFNLILQFKYGMFSKWERPFCAGYIKSEPDGF